MNRLFPKCLPKIWMYSRACPSYGERDLVLYYKTNYHQIMELRLDESVCQDNAGSTCDVECERVLQVKLL